MTGLQAGRAWTDLVELAKTKYPWVCHLCGEPIPKHQLPRGHPLRYEADHVLPASTHPHLVLVLTNVRPSHSRCNKYRGNRPLTKALIAEIKARFVTKRPALEFFAAIERWEGGGHSA